MVMVGEPEVEVVPGKDSEVDVTELELLSL